METASLSIRVTQEGATATAAALHGVSQAGAAAEGSFGALALRIAGFTSLANVAVDAGRKVVSMLVDTAKESVVLAAGFEKSRITWGVLVGDMDKGTAIFEKIRTFANTTPLSFVAANQAATTVKGFGVAANDIIPVLSKLGDVAMGDNNKLQSLALVYGQTLAQGKAKAQDLYQFINAGVPIFQLLADSMNTSAGAIKGLAADGAITFEEIDKALTKATAEGGMFYDLMDKVAVSAEGRWSTAVDSWQAALARLGEKTLPVLTKALSDFTAGLDRAMDISNARDFFKSPYAYKGDLDSVKRGLKDEYQNSAGMVPGDFGYEFSSDNAFQNYTTKYNQIKTAEEVQRANQSQALRAAARKAGDAAAAAAKELDKNRTWWESSGYAGGKSLEERDSWFASHGSNAGALLTPDEMNRLGGTTSYNASMFGNLWGPGQNGQWQDTSAFDEAHGSGMGMSTRPLESINSILTDGEKKALKFKQSIYAIGDALTGIGEQGYVDSFKSLGEAWASGANGADSLGSSIANIGATILDQMPMLLLQAGLSAIIAGQVGPGLLLLGASGLVAIGSGVADYYSGDTANAMGGVYNSPSLHSYVNGVYDSPRHFAFAKGGVFGEAGPEAIMPLARTSGGSLGVRTTGGSVSVSVVNNLGVEASASVEQTTGADGSKQIKILLEKAIAETLASGKADKALGSRYGLQAQGRRVQ